MVTTGIRKISMPPQMVDNVKDFAWRERTSVSALVREVLEVYLADPRMYKDVADTDEPVPAVLTVYVPDDIWLDSRDTAYANGRIPISVIIRKGLIARMTATAA
jgi:hypothetical protein